MLGLKKYILYKYFAFFNHLLMPLTSLSPAFLARFIAYSHTSAASLCASCLKQATAARLNSKWELPRWTYKRKLLFFYKT